MRAFTRPNRLRGCIARSESFIERDKSHRGDSSALAWNYHLEILHEVRLWRARDTRP